MTTLFRARSNETINENGISYYVETGHPIEIDGEPGIACGGVIYRQAANWHPSRADALREVAERVQELADLLSAQAREMRAGRDVNVYRKATKEDASDAIR